MKLDACIVTHLASHEPELSLHFCLFYTFLMSRYQLIQGAPLILRRFTWCCFQYSRASNGCFSPPLPLFSPPLRRELSVRWQREYLRPVTGEQNSVLILRRARAITRDDRPPVTPLLPSVYVSSTQDRLYRSVSAC